MKKLLLMVILVLSGVSALLAQRTIQGKITDEKGQPVIGANILAKGTTTGTVTDFDGRYTLNVPKGVSAIVVSYTGYSAREMELGASNVVDVSVAEDAKILSDVIVTALGVSRSEKSLGYAAQKVTGQSIVESNTTNVIDALAGKASGVQITSSSGAAGASSRIILRGQTSLDGNNQALMVIDGLRIDNSEFNTEANTAGVSQSNRAIDINPNDIESITILKGAAASALYGIDGSRGVILITTKKGNKKGSGLSVEYSSTVTLTQASLLPQLQNKFAKGTGGNYRGAGTATSTSWGPRMDTMYFDGVANEYDRNGNLVGKSNPAAKLGSPANVYDPYKVFGTGVGVQHNFAISGGDASKATYRLTFGNLNDNGFVPKNNFTRTTIGLASSAHFLDNKFHINSTINYTRSTSRRIQQGSNLSGLMLGLLRTPPSFDNSNGITDHPEDSTRAFYFSNGNQRTYRNGVGYDNPYWVISKTPYNDEVNRLVGNVDATYDLTSWLKVNAKVGTDVYNDVRKQSFEVNSRTAAAGRVIDDRYSFRSLDAYLNLLGQTNLSNDLSLGYTLGMNIYQKFLTNLTVQGDELAFPGYPSLNNTATKTVTPYNLNSKNFSLLGSVDLGYKNFLYLTLTGRKDYVSNLIVPNQTFDLGRIGFFYPSVSTSFVFTELMKPSRVLNFGKLRLSYGQVGGGAPDPYQTYTAYRVPTVGDGFTDGIRFPFNGLTGYTLDDTKGNGANLKPSTTTDREAGLELKFFNNRISIDASYYQRNSKNLIFPVPTAPSSGFTAAILNSGELKTLGYDITLGISPIRLKDFSWDISANITHWKTTVEKLADGVNTQFLGGFSGTGVYNIVGKEYGQIYSGAWQRTNDGNKYNPEKDYNPNGQLVVGTDGFPLLDEKTNRAVGNPNPKYLLGLTNSFTVYGFTLSALLDVRSGGQMWNGTKGALTNFGMSRLTENRNTKVLFAGVQADGSPNKTEALVNQAWYQGLGSGFGPNGEQFIESSSFMRLRTIGLSYRFQPSVLKLLHLTDLSLSFTGRNLWIRTAYSGVDPETSLTGGGNAQGLDYFNQPGAKSYAFGLSLKF